MEDHAKRAETAVPASWHASVVPLFPGPEGLPDRKVNAQLRKGQTRKGELGMATAEYAVATLAAVGFAGLLVVILRSDEVRGFLLGLIRNALSIG